jgi:hypothetical protein
VTGASERPGPIARLIGSFANALIDLGLPSLRQWLRERLGPRADVKQVSTDGAFLHEKVVHLDGVEVPIGSRGLLVLARATLSGLPEVQLRSFTGVLTLGKLHADVSFAAASEPPVHRTGDDLPKVGQPTDTGERTWISGDLAFRATLGGAEWTGRARLVASPREWRVEDGVLQGDGLEAAFHGAGLPDGSELGASLRGTLRLAALLRALSPAQDALGRPSAVARALPRDEDVATIDLTVRGSAQSPEVFATVRAPELGFRLGRARFVPPVLLRDAAAEVLVLGGRIVVRSAALARDQRVAVEADADLRAPSVRASARATVRADLDAAFARDVLRTLGASSSVRPVEGAVSLVLAVSHETSGFAAHGTASAARVVVGVAHAAREETVVALEQVTARLALDRTRLAYDDLRFRAHGGQFIAEGRLGFGPTSDGSSPLFLRLERGGAELAGGLIELFGGRAGVGSVLPADLAARGTLDLHAGGSLEADVVLETPAGTTLGMALRRSGLDGALDGSSLRGAVSVADLCGSGALGARPPVAPEGIVVVDLAARGAPSRGEVVATGWTSATKLAVLAGETRLAVTNVTARLRADARGVTCNGLDGALFGGRIEAVAVASYARSIRARISLADTLVHELPSFADKQPGTFVRGRLSADVYARFDPGRHVRASGEVRLDDAAFPALELVRPALARYGLRPPPEEARGPATAILRSSEWGLTLEAVAVDLVGAIARGSIGASWSRAVEGRAEVTLEEDYLRSSGVLALPGVLTTRLVAPIRIDGTLEAPRVHAELGESLGRFLKDNRVSAFVASAVEEAQILLGGQPAVDAPLRDEPDRDLEREVGAELEAELAAHASDWEDISARLRRLRT